MATINRFEELRVWQKARFLADAIFQLTQKGAFGRDYELQNQINRSSGSVMDNIAEGFGRGGRAEFVQFLGYSMGSLCETKSQLYRANDRTYISSDDLTVLYEQADDTSRMIRGLMASVKESPYRGYKFKEDASSYSSPIPWDVDAIKADMNLLTDSWHNNFVPNT